MPDASPFTPPSGDGAILSQICRVLLVDGDAAMLGQIKQYLEAQESRFQVATAESAESAFMSLVAFTPDVVVLDTCLPDMNGIEILNQIQDILPHAHLVVLTEDGSEELREAALREGAVRFLEKPVELPGFHRLLLELGSRPKHGETGILEGGAMDILDLFQMMYLCKKSASMRFAVGRKRATLRFEKGEAVYIDDGATLGSQAFFNIVQGWGLGRFCTLPEESIADLEPNNGIPCVTLLLEAAVLRDQAGSGTDSILLPIEPVALVEPSELPPPSPSDVTPAGPDPAAVAALLQELVTLDGARLALVVDWDGSMLQGRARDRKLSMESIGAAISSSLGSTQVLGRELRVGGASLVSLEYQQGTLLIRVLGSTGILAILADAEANLGRLRVQLNKRASAFEALG